MLSDFWLSIRVAAKFLNPKVVAKVVADSPAIDTNLIQEAMIWFTPKSVEGFDPDDFGFLQETERSDLCEAVNRFREITLNVGQDKSPSAAETIKAAAAFRQILSIVHPERYADPDALRIGKQLEHQLATRLPPAVDELRFETGTDANEDPALWIWVILKDEFASRERLLPVTKAVRDLLVSEVREIDESYWPYVRFRTVSELSLQPS